MTTSAPPPDAPRRFLFLQGPHGPFFDQLAALLRSAGAQTWRVAFNRGDQFFWSHRPGLIPFRAAQDMWPETCSEILADLGITDLVIYGDTRPVHAAAIAHAGRLGIRVHIFEEGYLRPHWVTYERGGSNGHSRLMDMTIAQMRADLAGVDIDLPDAPARWGDMRQHIFYGALYHYLVLTRARAYPGFRPHRALPVRREFTIHLKRLLLMPLHRIERAVAERRINNGGFPFHLVMLQLEHDASFQAHGPFGSMTDFVGACISAFAKGAPRHHHLVFKAHPLEDGRVPLSRVIRSLAHASGLGERVHYVRGGKLARLLDQARSAVTVNSTAGQQVLWRGLPLRALGRAVYGQPELVSDQPLAEFFARPTRPDSRAYRDFRHYLLETSQVSGGFYSARGRRQLLRQVVDMVLDPLDPYDALTAGNAAPRQQLRIVR